MGLKQLTTHRVKAHKATKAEKREMAERIEAFDAALGRLAAFGQGQAGTGPLSGADVDQLIVAATRGPGAVAIPRLQSALGHASALRGAHAAGDMIDAASGLTTTDLDLVAATAGETLATARAAAAAARGERMRGVIWAAVAFVIVAGVLIAIIRG